MRLLVVSMLLVFCFPFIIMTDDQDSFQTCKQFFLKEQPPMISDILKDLRSQYQNQYKIICQKYKNSYRFATLYDIINKIPLFSAYKYTGHAGTRPKNAKWMIEPQLKDLSPGMGEECSNQACNIDYVNNVMEVNRGHLFPCCHAADQETLESTFTLTNAVPQYITFNGGSWSRMEQTVRETMNSHCRDENKPGSVLAYVLTGSVPSQTPPHILNNRVNIPSHMWTVFCCYSSTDKTWVSQAHWAENIDEKEKGKTISVQTLEKLQTFLKNKYNKETSLFNGDCLVPLNADVSKPQDTDGDDEPDVRKQSWWSTIKNLPAAFWDWLRGY